MGWSLESCLILFGIHGTALYWLDLRGLSLEENHGVLKTWPFKATHWWWVSPAPPPKFKAWTCFNHFQPKKTPHVFRNVPHIFWYTKIDIKWGQPSTSHIAPLNGWRARTYWEALTRAWRTFFRPAQGRTFGRREIRWDVWREKLQQNHWILPPMVLVGGETVKSLARNDGQDPFCFCPFGTFKIVDAMIRNVFLRSLSKVSTVLK